MQDPNKPKVVAVDLDGTILKQVPYPTMGEALPGFREELEILKRLGWVIVIWTCRGPAEYDAVRAQLDAHGIPHDYINENPYGVPNGSPKIYADVYVDDRGLRFEGEARGLAARVMSHRPWHKLGPWGGKVEETDG
jgi:hypothetical protein